MRQFFRLALPRYAKRGTGNLPQHGHLATLAVKSQPAFAKQWTLYDHSTPCKLSVYRVFLFPGKPFALENHTRVLRKDYAELG